MLTSKVQYAIKVLLTLMFFTFVQSNRVVNVFMSVCLSGFTFFCLFLPPYCQGKIDGSNDYDTNKKDMQSNFKTITINPKGINPLFGNVCKIENIKEVVGNYMTLWRGQRRQ